MDNHIDLGRVGVWSAELRSDDPARRGEILEAAAELEELGYGAIWLGASPNVEQAARLIEATSRIVVATGILNIWQHSPADVAAAQAELDVRHPGRFLLGLGVSHPHRIEGYRRPLAVMGAFLDGLDAAGSPRERRVLAALRPRMLGLARARSAGAHPYNVPVEHTRIARGMLGAGPLLAPEVKVVLETSAERARAIARDHLDYYLGAVNYTNNLRDLGYTDEDLSGGGSDRLIDGLVAHGDTGAAVERIAAHHAAGADHVCVQVLTGDRATIPLSQWRELAAALRLGAIA